MEEELKKQARKKGLKGKRANSYIYGTMVKYTNWRPKKKKKKGK